METQNLTAWTIGYVEMDVDVGAVFRNKSQQVTKTTSARPGRIHSLQHSYTRLSQTNMYMTCLCGRLFAPQPLCVCDTYTHADSLCHPGKMMRELLCD